MSWRNILSVAMSSNTELTVQDAAAVAFNEGRAFRIGYEFNLSTTSDDRVIRLVLTNNIVLTKSSLELDSGGVRYTVIAGGASVSTFSETISTLAKNGKSDAPSFTTGSTFAGGVDGAVVTSGTELPIARIRTASGNNSRSTNLSDSSERRGFAPGTYYLHLENLPAVNDDSTGILNLEWYEEL